jgi:hypothetical protein
MANAAVSGSRMDFNMAALDAARLVPGAGTYIYNHSE